MSLWNWSIFTRTHYSFSGIKEGEVVRVLVYRHWFTLVPRLVILALLALLPFVVGSPIGGALDAAGLSGAGLFLAVLYYLILWYLFFYIMTMYFLDTWMVTTLRVIDSTQRGLFRRIVSELHLSRVEDVSVILEGIVPTMLNFGNLDIQTAGPEQRFEFKQIPNPQRVKEEIMKAAGEFRRQERVSDEAMV